MNVLRNQALPELLLPMPKHNYRALPDRQPLLRLRNAPVAPQDRPQTVRHTLPNSGEGLRAAYYVQDDAASYSSLKEHVHQIDLLFPQWLHIDSPNGTLMAMSSDNLREYPVIEGNTVHDPDDLNRVKRVIQARGRHGNLPPRQQLQSRTPKAGTTVSAPCSRILTRARPCAARSCVS